MSETNSVNYNALFKWATADTDLFDRVHVADLAATLDVHDHASNRGLGVKRLQTSSAPAAAGEVRVNGDDLQWWGASAAAVQTAKSTANLFDTTDPAAVDAAVAADDGAATTAAKRDHIHPANHGTLNRDVTAAAATNTTSETTLFSYTVAASKLGSDHALRLTAYGDLISSGADNTPTFRVKYGSTTIATFTPAAIVADASRKAWKIETLLSVDSTGASAERAVTNCWIGGVASAGNGPTAVASLAHQLLVHNAITENSGSALDLVLTVQNSTATATSETKCWFATVEFI